MTPDAFRKLALTVPASVESAHMNHPDFRLAGKVFASLGAPDAERAMVKLSPEEQQAFIAQDPASFQPCNGAWGRAGCTNVQLAVANRRLVASALKAAAQNVLRTARARKKRG